MTAYFATLAATGGLAWGGEIVISAVGLAGAAGLLMAFLIPVRAEVAARA